MAPPGRSAIDAVASDAGLVGDNRPAAFCQPVKERGLAHVGPPDNHDRGHTGLGLRGHFFISRLLGAGTSGRQRVDGSARHVVPVASSLACSTINLSMYLSHTIKQKPTFSLRS